MMKIIITESKYEEGILNYLKANYYPEYAWGPELHIHSFYKIDVKKYGGIDFYVNGLSGYGYQVNGRNRVLNIDSLVCDPLYNLFGYKWVPIFKEWFEENTGLEVNEIVLFPENEEIKIFKF